MNTVDKGTIDQADILAFGEPMYEFSQINGVREGEPDFLSGFGGDASNYAIAAARQGASVGMVTQLGCDEFGDRFMRLWEKEGVLSNTVTRLPHAHTGVYFITHSDKGHEFSFMRKGSAASLIDPGSLPVTAIKNAKLLHVTAITQAISTSSCDAVFKAIKIAKENNVLVSYDTNLRLKLWSMERARATINETISQVDICFPSIDEARLLTGLEAADEIIDFYLGLGAKIVVLKQGGEGATVADGKIRHHVKPLPSQVIDATAAGDSFAGAFCCHYVAGHDLVTCLEYANATASITITGYGAVAPLPYLADVENKLAACKKDA